MKTLENISWAAVLLILIGINVMLFTQDINIAGWAIGDGNDTLQIDLVNPTNNSILNESDVTIALGTSHAANCSLNGSLMNITGETAHGEFLTNLSNGEYNYDADCNDGNTTSISFGFTINVTKTNTTENETEENETCEININSPENNSITNVNITTINVTSNCDCNETTNATLNEGNNEIIVECNNITKTINVVLDTIGPVITKVSPSYTQRDNNVWMNVTTNEDAECNVDNESMTKTSLTHKKELTGLTEDQIYNKTVTCNDSLNNSNNLSISFKVDEYFCGDDICQNNEDVDCEDCDKDDDGILDEDDSLLGDKNDVDIENMASLAIKVGDTYNLKKEFTGEKTVEFQKPGYSLLLFDFDFDDDVLDLRNVSIEIQKSSSEFGYVIVRNLNLEGNVKAVYVDAINNSNKLCIKDEDDVEEINDVSDDCSGSNEKLINCPGDISDYSCTKSGDKYILLGLENTAIREIRGSSTTTAVQGCSTGWTCKEWTPAACPPEKRQTRTCTNSIDAKCTTGKPSVVKICEYAPTCNDKTKNQGETEIDCGGPCGPCTATQNTTTLTTTQANTEAPRNLLKKDSPLLFYLVLTMIVCLLGLAGYYYYAVEIKGLQDFNENDIKEASSLLSENIHKAFVQGYKEEDIKQSLVTKGWHEEIVNKVMAQYKLGHHHDKLDKYIVSGLKKGKTKQAIKSSLLLKKWPEKVIEESIKRSKLYK